MKFQSKMRIVYIGLGILAAVVSGCIYYSISADKIYEHEMNNLTISAAQLNQQYDEMIKTMEDISYYLLSDPDMLDAITSISTMTRSESTEAYFQDAERVIATRQNNDYIRKRFYRVIFCNDNCEPIGNNVQIRKDADYKEMPWYEKARKNPDTYTTAGMHWDLWGEDEDVMVFSVIKQIQGPNMGYIEVQQSADRVREKLRMADEELKVCLLSDEGELLYWNTQVDMEFCRSLLGRGNIPAGKFSGSGGVEYLASGVYNEEVKALMLVYKDSSIMQDDMLHIMYMTIFLVGAMLLFSMLYVAVSTRHLTKSMHQLQKVLENTSLETLTSSAPMDFDKESDEFQKIGRVYEDMRSRLGRAIDRERQLQTLQLQAQFDMLQAQVNPHFIYNALNVISSRGILDDDEVICDMCDDLAGLLRYSTDTKEKYATIKAELTYLKLYFSLLKYRYEHKLEYTIELDEAIGEQRVPKLVIQQLTENSINHGYGNSSKVMRLSVIGWQEENHWCIRIRDNGEGFSEEVLVRLTAEMEKLKQDLLENRRNVEMKIGGMGILNTYARLYLMNGENLIFRLQNREEGGAEIIIGSVIQTVQTCLNCYEEG